MSLIVRNSGVKETLPTIFLTKKEIARIRSVKRDDLGYGYDNFGMDISTVVMVYSMLRPLYENYFRVESFGQKNIPPTGPVVLIANNAGTVAYDGMMIFLDRVEQLMLLK